MAETLCEELVEEVLVRLSLDDPESLVRAALVCRKWARIVSGPGFRNQFRKFHHGGPPMLGFITTVDLSGYADPEEGLYGNDSDSKVGDGEDFEDSEVISRFHSTSTFRPLPGPGDSRLGWHAVDSNHGRVLLYPLREGVASFENILWVWCPITGEELQLPRVRRCPNPQSWSAALICAADAEAGGGACDHLVSCHRRPFLVVLVGTDKDDTFSCVYSSASGAWGHPTSAQIPRSLEWLKTEPAARVGNALYFLFQVSARILRYDVTARGFSVIERPHPCSVNFQGSAVLMSMEGGTLGFTAVHGYRLRLWERVVGADGEAAWVRRKAIRLRTDGGRLPYLTGSACGVGVFVWTDGSQLALLNLMTGQATHVETDVEFIKDLFGLVLSMTLVPYMTYCIPAVPAALRRLWN